MSFLKKMKPFTSNFLQTQEDSATPQLDPATAALKEALDQADAVVVGAGAGLSTSAGFTYTGERFQRYFADFAQQYAFADMYAGGFYPYNSLEEHWAYWSRYIYVNRFMDPPKPVYDQLFSLIKNKDYFVLTTNVDHCFQKAGFDKHRLFYTQGDYGLFQCSKPCCQETFDNQELITAMVKAQGFDIDARGQLLAPPAEKLLRHIPPDLLPVCPHCGQPQTMNLRSDASFVEDEGWHVASSRYAEFLRRHDGMRVLYLELGVGGNTPGIIKYPFWHFVQRNPRAHYACLNFGEAFAPEEIKQQSLCFNEDIGAVLDRLR